MYFIGRNKQGLAWLNGIPLTVAVNFAGPRMHKHFMLPIVGVFRRMASRGNDKDSHAEIIGAVGLSD